MQGLMDLTKNKLAENNRNVTTLCAAQKNNTDYLSITRQCDNTQDVKTESNYQIPGRCLVIMTLPRQMHMIYNPDDLKCLLYSDLEFSEELLFA